MRTFFYLQGAEETSEVKGVDSLPKIFMGDSGNGGGDNRTESATGEFMTSTSCKCLK